MERSEIIEIIKTVISEETEISKEEIQENSLLMRDLELSSLELLAIIGKLEEKMGIKTDMDELQAVTTVGELGDYLLSILPIKK